MRCRHSNYGCPKCFPFAHKLETETKHYEEGPTILTNTGHQETVKEEVESSEGVTSMDQATVKQIAALEDRVAWLEAERRELKADIEQALKLLLALERVLSQ